MMTIRWTQILILSITIWSFSAWLFYFYYLNRLENKSTQNYPHDPPERSIIKTPIAEEISGVNVTHPSFTVNVSRTGRLDRMLVDPKGCTSRPAPVCGRNIDCINPQSECLPKPNALGLYHFVPLQFWRCAGLDGE